MGKRGVKKSRLGEIEVLREKIRNMEEGNQPLGFVIG